MKKKTEKDTNGKREKKSIYKYLICIIYSVIRKSIKKNKIWQSKKKTERETKRVHLFIEKLATQIKKNLPSGI